MSKGGLDRRGAAARRRGGALSCSPRVPPVHSLSRAFPLLSPCKHDRPPRGAGGWGRRCLSTSYRKEKKIKKEPASGEREIETHSVRCSRRYTCEGPAAPVEGPGQRGSEEVSECVTRARTNSESVCPCPSSNSAASHSVSHSLFFIRGVRESVICVRHPGPRACSLDSCFKAPPAARARRPRAARWRAATRPLSSPCRRRPPACSAAAARSPGRASPWAPRVSGMEGWRVYCAPKVERAWGV